MKRVSIAFPVSAVLLLGGCQTAYYYVMEKVGVAKRDILVSRVKSARDSQEAAKKEIQSALDQFGEVVSYQGGDLKAQYRKLSGELENAEDAADDVRKRIKDVQDVANALFKEWKFGLSRYTDADLRQKSEQQLLKTRSRYDEMIGAMMRAESKLEPALQPLRDQVLFLKQNLDARATVDIKGEVSKADARVNQLLAELNRSIAEADRFIKDLEKTPG
jgi:chromosome segregation ATPase